MAKPKPPKRPKKPSRLTDAQIEAYNAMSKALRLEVFERRLRFFPEARRRTLRLGTYLMPPSMLVGARKMTKNQLRAAARDKKNEIDGYNPFWYHV